MPHRGWVTFVAALFAAFATVGPAFGQAAPAESHTIPFTLLPSRHMVVAATVDGKGPYKFIFDTGAPLNLISSKVGKDAKLSVSFPGNLTMLLGPQQVKIGKLKLGGATAENVPAMVMDHPTVKAISDAFKYEAGPLQGIIGFPFFARYATTIDYQKKELTFTPTDYKPGNYLDEMTDKLTAAAAAGSAPKVTAPAGLWGLTVGKPAGDDAAGVVVKVVADGGPAATAGLKPGDRLLTTDGRWTDSVADAALAASLVKQGRTVELTLTRDGKDMKLQLTPTNGL